MTPIRHQEIERTYEVQPSTILPDLVTIPGVTSSGQQVTHDLVATYFDTADLALARHGVTLRRRTGGDDAGWHLKLPVGKHERTEVRLPLGTEGDSVPAELLHPVRAVVRDHPLAPVATIRNHRLRYDLVDGSDLVLAQVCDDDVHAQRLRGDPLTQHWREWEVELVDGEPGLLDEVEAILLPAGARPASTGSKLLRALADAAPSTPARPHPRAGAGASAEDLLRGHLREQVAVLHRHDARFRAGLPGSVHKLRIAARRIRSALTSFRPVLARGSVDVARAELRWLGQVLAESRDAEVIHQRLRELVAAEPAELVLGPVLSRIDGELAQATQQGRVSVLQALESERYFRLLDLVDALVDSLPTTERAVEPAAAVLPDLLRRDLRRLRRAARRARRTTEAPARDVALHATRKAAKRLRYAAELTVPLFGGRAKRLAKAARRVQESLGDHHDSVVARHQLREYAVQAFLDGENGFTFGRLHGLEEARALDAERRFATAWKSVPHRRELAGIRP